MYKVCLVDKKSNTLSQSDKDIDKNDAFCNTTIEEREKIYFNSIQNI